MLKFFRKILLTTSVGASLLLPQSVTAEPSSTAVPSNTSEPPVTLEQSDLALLSLLKQAINQADSFEDRYDAEVWLLSKSTQLERFLPDEKQRFELLKMIHREAIRADISPEIVLALIEVESRFDRYAISRVGAQGLMQIMPFWKKEIGRPQDNLMDTQTNLRYGCTILKHYLGREKNHLSRALARYNGSVGKTWYSERVFSAWEQRWR